MFIILWGLITFGLAIFKIVWIPTRHWWTLLLIATILDTIWLPIFFSLTNYEPSL